jgi:hypothetical protein
MILLVSFEAKFWIVPKGMQSAIILVLVGLKSLNHFSAKTPSLDGDYFSYRDPRFGLVFVAARSTHIRPVVQIWWLLTAEPMRRDLTEIGELLLKNYKLVNMFL